MGLAYCGIFVVDWLVFTKVLTEVLCKLVS